MPPRRALISASGTFLEKMMEGMITQKTNELQILSNERDSLNTELSAIKDRLRSSEITIPDNFRSTGGYQKGSNLPFSSVQDNITMAESMINSKQGEIDSLNQVWNDYMSGKALMQENEAQYAALDSVSKYDTDAFILSGGMDDTTTAISDPQEFYNKEGKLIRHLKGGMEQEVPDSEMSKLIASLSDEDRKKLETNPQFKQGFLAARTTEEQASNKALLRLNVLNASDQVRTARKTDVQEDFDKTRLLLDNSVTKYGEVVASQLKVGGTPLSMFGTTLMAQDMDSYNELMSGIAENPNLNLIQDEILTMIDASNSNSYYPLLGVLGNMYEETSLLIDMENRWKRDMPDTYATMVDNAINGRYNLIHEAFVEDAKQFNRLYRRQAQFRNAGLLPDEDDLQTALIAIQTEKELTNNELSFLGRRAAGTIDEKYYKGLGFDLERIAGRISEDYVPSGTEAEYLSGVDEIVEAHNAWLLLEDEDFGAADPVLSLNDLVNTANNNKMLDNQLATSKKSFLNARGNLNLELIGQRTELTGVSMSVPWDIEKLGERVLLKMKSLSAKGKGEEAAKLKQVYEDYTRSFESYQQTMLNHQENRPGSWANFSQDYDPLWETYMEGSSRSGMFERDVLPDFE